LLLRDAAGPMSLGVTIGIAAVCGIAGAVIAERLKVPSILTYLVFGLLLGPAGLAVVPIAALHGALPVIVPLAAAIVLFEGGLSLDVRAIRGATRVLQRLIFLGGALSFVGGTLIGWAVAGLPLGAAAIFGSLMIVTGPTVIGPILRRVPLVPRVRTLLHWESILIDPLGVIVAVLVAEYVLASEAGARPALRVLGQLGGGSVVGLAVGVLSGLMLGRRYFASATRAESANLIAVAAALGAYALAELVTHEAGIVAVTLAGLTLSAFHVPWLASVKHFKEQLTTLLVATLFVLISASIDPRGALALGWRVWSTVALVALVLRPLGVFLSTFRSDVPVRERVYVSWIGPRGIIAAAVASLSAIKLREHGVPGGDELEIVVFTIIGFTVAVQGLSAGLVARILGVRAEPPTGVVLAGANGLARALGTVLAREGLPVRLVDSSDSRCEAARRQGLEAVVASLGDRGEVEKACEGMGTFIAMTPYAELNVLAALLAREFVGAGSARRVRLPGRDAAARIGHIDPDDLPSFPEPMDVAALAQELDEGRSIVTVRPVGPDGRLDVDLGPDARRLLLLRAGQIQELTPGKPFRRDDRVIVVHRRFEADRGREERARDEPSAASSG
jgi:NhaP-type Na+/H+ or K+/H+ antiporter